MVPKMGLRGLFRGHFVHVLGEPSILDAEMRPRVSDNLTHCEMCMGCWLREKGRLL